MAGLDRCPIFAASRGISATAKYRGEAANIGHRSRPAIRRRVGIKRCPLEGGQLTISVGRHSKREIQMSTKSGVQSHRARSATSIHGVFFDTFGGLTRSAPSVVIASDSGSALRTGACDRCAEGSEIIRTGTEGVFCVRNLLFCQPSNLSIHRCTLI